MNRNLLQRVGRMLAPLVVALLAVACMSSAKPPRKDLEKDAGHHYRWAQEQYRRGNYLEALESIDKAVDLAPDDYSNFYMRAHIYLAADEPDKAVADLQHVLEMNPYFTDAHNTMGVALAKQGNRQGALAEFDKALADPKYLYKHKVYFNRGNLYFEGEEYDKAVGEYQRAIAAEPAYVTAHFKLGKALQALGRDDEARQAFDEVLRLAPGSELAREVEMSLRAAAPSS